MYVKVDTRRGVGIGIVLLRDKDQEIGELWIPVECPDALKNVAVEYLEDFACDDDFAPYKPWPARRELVIDDCIKLTRVLV